MCSCTRRVPAVCCWNWSKMRRRACKLRASRMTLRILATAVWRPAFLLLATPIAMSVHSVAHTGPVPKDFSVTLERTGCVGSCPGYKVTILADGSVHYEGLYYVQAEGVRRKTIPAAKIEKVA